jgi:hypothetical protein
LYTNDARKIAAVPSWFQFCAPLSEVMSFVCVRSASLCASLENFLRRPFHFGKAKSAMLKIISSDSSAGLDAAIPFWKAFTRPQTLQLMNLR